MPYEPDPPLKKAYTENTFLHLSDLVPAELAGYRKPYKEGKS